MNILPENKPHTPVDTPRNFFIYGATMSGKSYLAERFPNPIFINTDGNSLAQSAPAIQVRNVKGPKVNGKATLSKNIIDQLDAIVTALSTEKHTYQTVVIDVIDDIAVMLEQAISIENGVQSLADIPYGKGFSLFNTVLQQFVMDLKSLPMNVIYISRVAYEGETEQTKREVPSLKLKYYNIVNGNADLVIHTQKLGKNYVRRVTDRRKNYQRDQIDDDKILKILDNVVGVFDKPSVTTKKDAEKIVKEIEKKEDVLIVAENEGENK